MAKGKRGRKPKYNWEKLLTIPKTRKRKTLKRGRDFDSQPYTFMMMARQRAKEFGLVLTFLVREDSVIITPRAEQ